MIKNTPSQASERGLRIGIMASSKGGKSGQWSARKAQMLAAEYKKKGGGYKGGKVREAKRSQTLG